MVGAFDKFVEDIVDVGYMSFKKLNILYFLIIVSERQNQ